MRMSLSLLLHFRKFLKRVRCILACCNSSIVIENSQLDGKQTEK